MNNAPPLPPVFSLPDIHTHSHDRPDTSIISLTPDDTVDNSLPHISVGIHPWDAGRADADMLERLDALAAQPNVVAIGEAGLDRRRGPALDVQLPVFVHQIRLSERLKKPLVIHCVGCVAELLHLRGTLRPTQPWIYHGFRGKEALARQLLDAGLYLSVNKSHNLPYRHALPPDRLLSETD